MIKKIKEYFEVEKDNIDCIFCKIIEKKIPSKIIFENNFCISFMDISPYSDGHVLVVPKKHFNNLMMCDEIYLKQVFDMVQKVTKKIDYSDLKPWGYNFLSNQGSIAGQVVNHFHVHIIPKYAKNEGFEIESSNKNIDNIDEVFTKIMKSKFIIE